MSNVEGPPPSPPSRELAASAALEPSLVDVMRATTTLAAFAAHREYVDALDPKVRLAFTTALKAVTGPPKRGPRRAAKPRAPTTPRSPQATCAICRQRFAIPERNAPRVCSACLADAAHKRAEIASTTSFEGRNALVTGGRIRLGKKTALALLRGGARVVVTTRFPAAAAAFYADEPDYASWCSRLTVAGLDLVRLDDVDRFVRSLPLPHLDIVVHNAAQTVKRDAAYYAPLVDLERRALPSSASSPSPSASPSPALAELRASGAVDEDGEPRDARANNSWTQRLDDVDTAEILEVLAVNATAPFALTRALLPLLQASPNPRRFVVCVTSREGQFHVDTKLSTHPHTNMAKAALNMMVRTSASSLDDKGITLVAVDPGWFSEQRAVDEPRTLPITLDDAVARVLAPIVDASSSSRPPCGVLYRDYKIAAW